MLGYLAGVLRIELRIAESKSVVIPFHYTPIKWSGVEESNLYNDFRRIMSYPLNERQLFGAS